MLTLKDSVYDTLKWLVIIVLPACATLYAALASVWRSEEHTSELQSQR